MLTKALGNKTELRCSQIALTPWEKKPGKVLSKWVRCNVNINFAFILIHRRTPFFGFIFSFLFIKVNFMCMAKTRNDITRSLPPTHHLILPRTFLSLENIRLNNNRRSVNILNSLRMDRSKVSKWLLSRPKSVVICARCGRMNDSHGNAATT